MSLVIVERQDEEPERYYTAVEVARLLGVSASLIRRRSKERKVGRQVAKHVRVYTEADIEALKPKHRPL